MSTVPYFQFYPSDYLADTTHLTTEQHGAYLLLLMTAWARGGRLPDDPKKLARICRVSPRRWHIISSDVLEFFEAREGEIVSPRMEKDYKKAVSKSAKRSAIGKRGGDAKALKTKKQGLAKATRLPCHLPEPDIKREAKASPKRGARLPDDWVLSKPLGEWAVEQGASVERVRFEAQQFKDYWISASGAKATKLDWDATWRTWIRRALNDRPEGPKGGPGNGRSGYATGEQAADLIAFAASFDERAEADCPMDHGPSAEPSGPLLPDPIGPERGQDDGRRLDRGPGGYSARGFGESSQGMAEIIPLAAPVSR